MHCELTHCLSFPASYAVSGVTFVFADESLSQYVAIDSAPELSVDVSSSSAGVQPQFLGVTAAPSVVELSAANPTAEVTVEAQFRDEARVLHHSSVQLTGGERTYRQHAIMHLGRSHTGCKASAQEADGIVTLAVKLTLRMDEIASSECYMCGIPPADVLTSTWQTASASTASRGNMEARACVYTNQKTFR